MGLCWFDIVPIWKATSTRFLRFVWMRCILQTGVFSALARDRFLFCARCCLPNIWPIYHSIITFLLPIGCMSRAPILFAFLAWLSFRRHAHILWLHFAQMAAHIADVAPLAEEVCFYSERYVYFSFIQAVAWSNGYHFTPWSKHARVNIDSWAPLKVHLGRSNYWQGSF